MQEMAFNTHISFPLSSSNAGCNLGLLVSLAPPTGHWLLQFPAAHCCSVPPLSLFCMCICVTTSGPGLHFFKRVLFWYDFSPQFISNLRRIPGLSCFATGCVPQLLTCYTAYKIPRKQVFFYQSSHPVWLSTLTCKFL